MGRVIHYLREFKSISDAKSRQMTKGITVKEIWKPPVVGKFKVNVDSAFSGGKVGIGVVIRDSVGELIASMASPIANVLKPSHLEALAITKGIKLVDDLAL